MNNEIPNSIEIKTRTITPRKIINTDLTNEEENTNEKMLYDMKGKLTLDSLGTEDENNHQQTVTTMMQKETY